MCLWLVPMTGGAHNTAVRFTHRLSVPEKQTNMSPSRPQNGLNEDPTLTDTHTHTAAEFTSVVCTDFFLQGHGMLQCYTHTHINTHRPCVCVSETLGLGHNCKRIIIII